MANKTKITNKQIEGSTGGTVLASDGSGNVIWGSMPTRITREDHTSEIDGVTTDFVLVYVPATGSEEVFLNGVLQNANANDYSIAGQTLSFQAAPNVGFTLLVSYNTSDYSFPGPIIDGGSI
jgi:hypothetical protein